VAELAFTTSWDDGHPLDLRIAEILARHGATGTFYVPCRNSEGRPVLTARELRGLDERFELGSHTVDHLPLGQLSARDRRYQIVEGKRRLEHELGHAVAGFAYPRGIQNAAIRSDVHAAGFAYARTITDLGLAAADPFRVPTTLQLYPHGRRTYLTNFVRGRAWPLRLGGFARVVASRELDARLDQLLELAAARGGVFHVWGHSWELQERGLWGALDRLLARVAEVVPAARRITNGAAYAPTTSPNTVAS
jgi:peptidoglycan/xylan/chitin deacetylase (PgdA/CDA1 family)